MHRKSSTHDSDDTPDLKKQKLTEPESPKDEITQTVKRVKKLLKVNPVFLCPISHEIMSDPVILSGGHTFDRCNIEEWLLKHDTCPITRAAIADRRLITNQSIKSQILEYKEKLVRKSMILGPPLVKEGGEAAQLGTRLLERAHSYAPNDENIRIALIEGLLITGEIKEAIKQTHSLLGLLDGDHEGSVQSLTTILRTKKGYALLENLEPLGVELSQCRHYESHFKVCRDAMLILDQKRVAATISMLLANLMDRHNDPEDEEEIAQIMLEAARLDPDNIEINTRVEQYMTKHNRLTELLMLTFRKTTIGQTDDRIQSFFTTVCNIVQQQKREISQLRTDLKALASENDRMAIHIPVYIMAKKLREYGATVLSEVRLISPIPQPQCRMHLVPSTNQPAYYVAHLCRSIVASCHSEGIIAVWNVETGQQLINISIGNGHDVIEVAPLGDDLFVALSITESHSARLQLINWRSDQVLSTVQCSASVNIGSHRKMVVFGNEDGSTAFVIVGHVDGTIVIYNLTYRIGQVITTLRGHTEAVTAIEVLTDGRLASTSDDKTIRLWDVETSECDAILQGHAGSITSLCLLSDNILASGSCIDECCIRLWNIQSGACIKRLTGHNATITQIMVLGRDLIASTSDDGTARMWTIADGKCVWTMSHSEKVRSLCTIKSTIVTVTERDNRIRVWVA
jgi:hypothetical protein